MVKLRVVEALQDDAYKGVVRIDGALMKQLKLERGDIVCIKGEVKWDLQLKKVRTNADKP